MAWLLSLKVFLISTGVVSLALGLKLSVPLVLEFWQSQVPLMWSFFLSWLKPPYLYIIINGIIITIAASSRFHNKESETCVELPSPIKIPANSGYEEKIPAKLGYEEKIPSNLGYEDKIPQEIRSAFGIAELPVVYEEKEEVIVTEVKNSSSETEVEDDEFVIPRSSWTPPKTIDSFQFHLPAEKPLVSVRLGHRKPSKSSPEGGRALRVSKPKRHETLENTWKAITEGRAMPLSRHMKKCETWENHGRLINVSHPDPSSMKKSETLKDRTNQQSSPVNLTPGPVKIRKEPSLSQDELNRRVEAFIKKFNEEMRLQRQASLNQYREMISR